MEASRNRRRLIMAVALTFSAACGAALATQSETEYEAALTIAQKKLARVHSSNEAGDAVSRLERSSRMMQLPGVLILNTFGRAYNKGESWLVASWISDPGTARMTSDASQLDERLSQGALFRFEVVADRVSGAELKVTCENASGFTCPDGNMKELRLTLDARGAVTRKLLYLNNNPAPVELSIDSIRGRALRSPIEAYALDIPELWSAARLKDSNVPRIPAQAINSLKPIHADAPVTDRTAVRDELWVQQDDPFGRPVHVLWADRELWPRYLRTATSISLLIRRDS